MNNRNYLGYKKEFKQLLENQVTVYNQKGDGLKLGKDEEWRQLYKPKVKIRRKFPKYIFVSNKGNVISLSRTEPCWLIPNANPLPNGRESYTLTSTELSKRDPKHHPIHLLVALAFEIEMFGKSKDIIAKKGRPAFTGGEVVVHHEEGYDKKKSRAFNNDPDTLSILTVEVHKLFKSAPKKKAKVSSAFTFMKEMQNVLCGEGIQTPTALVPKEESDGGKIGRYDISSEELSGAIKKSGPLIYMRAPLNRVCANHFWDNQDDLRNRVSNYYKTFGISDFEMSVYCPKNKMTYQVPVKIATTDMVVEG